MTRRPPTSAAGAPRRDPRACDDPRARDDRRERRGASTVELLVSLWIFLLLCALANALVAMARERAARVAGSTHAAAVLRHAAAPLAHDLRGRAAGDRIVVDDSTVDLVAHVGAAVVCGRQGAALVVPAAAREDEAPLTTLGRMPEAGDLLHLLEPDAAGGRWREHRVTDARHVAGAPCAIGAATFEARPPLRIQVTPPPAGVAVGASLRLSARARYSLYRGGDGAWQLGYRRCGADSLAACAGVQPVAGPLLPYRADPARRGLVVEPLAADGSVLPRGQASRAAAFRVTLRAPRAAARLWVPVGDAAEAADSLVVRVATRNRP